MKKLLLILVSALFIISCASFSFAADVPYPYITNFSFASDTYDQGFTFQGGPNGISSDAEVDLMFDLNHDQPGGLVTFTSYMKFSAYLYDYRVYQVGSQWLHVWKVKANIDFYHQNPPPSPPLLSIKFQEGLLTSWSSSPYAIGNSMTLQDSEYADQSIDMFPHPLLNGIGIRPECLKMYESLAFTFTNIYCGNAPGGFVSVDKSGNFLNTWVSEGSFSASACYPIF